METQKLNRFKDIFQRLDCMEQYEKMKIKMYRFNNMKYYYLRRLICVAGMICIVYFLILPFLSSNSSIEPILNLEHFELNIEGVKYVEILDSPLCKDYKYGVCIEKSCKQSTYPIRVKKYSKCAYKVHISEDIYFNKFIIGSNNDNDDQILVYFRSKNLRSKNLFFYGYDMTIQADQIQSENIYFDSYLGSFKVENLISEQSLLNTSNGDIIIQTYENTELSTITKEKYVCITCKQSWKDNVSKVNNMNEVFEEKDKDKEECFKAHKYINRDQKLMVQQEKHSVFEQLKLVKTQNQGEIRCNYVNSLILMNGDNIPVTVQNLKKIKASNHDGNIYINILSKNKQLEQQVINQSYESQNIKLSEESSKSLNSTLRSIIDSGLTNEIVYLDFRQSNDRIEDFVFILIFNPIYLHITPQWLAALSFNSFSSSDKREVPSLQPGICPYIFSYSTFGVNEEQLVQMNEQLVYQAIESFLESENIDVFLLIQWKKYHNITLGDEDTYPPIDNIDVKINYMTYVKVICGGLLIIFVLVTYILIQYGLYKMKIDNKRRDMEKIVYLFFSRLDIIDSKTKNTKGIVKNKLQCKLKSRINPFQDISFTNLSLITINWMQTRYFCSFDLFLKQLITYQKKNQIIDPCPLNIPEDTSQKKQSNSANEKKSYIKITQLKQYYQIFCSLFNLKYEFYQFKEENDTLKQIQYNYQYKQTIVFQKYGANSEKIIQQIEKDEIQQYNESSQKNIQQIEKDEIQQQNESSEKIIQQIEKDKIQQQNESSQKNIQLIEKDKIEQQNESSQKNTQLIEKDKIQQQNESSQKNIQLIEKDKQQNEQINNKKVQYFIVKLSDSKKRKFSKIIDEKKFQNNQYMNLSDFYQLFHKNKNNDHTGEQKCEKQKFFVYGTYTKILAKSHKIQPNQNDYNFNEEFLEQYQNLFREFLVEKQFQNKSSKVQQAPPSSSSTLKNPNIQDNQNDKLIYQAIVPDQQNKSDQKQNDINTSQSLQNSQINEEEIKQELIKSMQMNDDLGYKLEVVKENLNRHYEASSVIFSKDSGNFFTQFKKLMIQLYFGILYFASPIIGSSLLITFIAIYMNQQYLKFDIHNYNKIFYRADFRNLTFGFGKIGISLLVYLIFALALIFYILYLTQNQYFTNTRRNIFKGELTFEKYKPSLKSKKQIILEKIKRMFTIHLYATPYYLITQIILILSMAILSFSFLFLVVGVVIFPRVKLPTLIFFCVLLGVVIQTIFVFKNEYDSGLIKLKEIFENKLKNKFKLYNKKQNKKLKNNTINNQQSQNNVQIDNTQNNQKSNTKDLLELATPLNKQSQSSVEYKLTHQNNDQNKNKDQQSFSRIQNFSSGQILKEEQNQPPNDQKKNDERKKISKPQIKDLRLHSAHPYKDIFDKIDVDQDKIIKEKEFKEFLEDINMKMNEKQLNQLYSHIFVYDSNNFETLKIWKMKKELDYRQFGLAINYIIKKKVNMALHRLDISYSSLCLSIIQTLIQSFIISYIIYGIQIGTSSFDTGFDFSSNSIVSLGSIVGIIFSRKEVGKELLDIEKIKQITDMIEEDMHSFN